MEQERDVLVAVCGCGEFIKVGFNDDFAAGQWISSHGISANLIFQLDVAKQVTERVPKSHCNECVKGIMSGTIKQEVSRTSSGVVVRTVYP